MQHLSTLVSYLGRDCIYDIIKYLNPSKCVDIGAAAGHVVQEMCQKWDGSLEEIIAFEPFPGNHQYITSVVQHCSCPVRLIKKAVSDKISVDTFSVPLIVQGDEPEWEEYIGYSSVGLLVSSLTPFRQFTYRLRNLLRFVKDDGRQNIKVETTTLDHEFKHTKSLSFVKVDVQGAEEQVLKGANSLLSSKRIDVIYIEWSGSKKVVDLLEYHNYIIYDTLYVVFPKKSISYRVFEELGLHYVRTINLSTGQQAYEMIMKADPYDVVNLIRRRNIGALQTDLIAIRNDIHTEFLAAVHSYNRKISEKDI